MAKHNLRKYRSKEYDRENIVLLFGSTNLMLDVKKVYQDTFSKTLEQYNQKQTRTDRRIDDYFEHLSGKNQDMAVENILQNSLRQTASIEMLIHFGVLVKEKQKGKNHDLTVAEYKVQQETKRLEMVAGFLEEKQDRLFDASQRLEQAEQEVSAAERHLSDTKMEIAGAEKEGLLEDIGVLDKEFEKRLDFINVLDKLKAILSKLLSMIPPVREFARLVEEKRDIRAASPYGYTPLGRLLKEYRTPLPRYDRLVTFPEVASWQTSKGEVVLVYEDYNGRGTEYQLAGFWNVQTEQAVKISEIREEIIPENWICTLEQAEVYVKAVENFMENMKTPENARNNHPVYQTHDVDYERSRQADDFTADNIDIVKCGARNCSALCLNKMRNYI